MKTFEINIPNKTVNGKEAIAVNLLGAQLASKLIEMQQQYKLFHWQTFSYAQHKAFDGIYDSLIDHVDKFMEVYMGKYGRPQANGNITISIANLSDSDFSIVTDSYIGYLTDQLPSYLNAMKDTDLLNIRDEMLGDLNQLKYLLSLV